MKLLSIALLAVLSLTACKMDENGLPCIDCDDPNAQPVQPQPEPVEPPLDDGR